MKLIFLFLVQIYCGFVQDSFISLVNGQIISYSINRNDPRFIIKNYTTNTSIVCAINDTTIWMVRNITGNNFQSLSQRSYHSSTFSQRTSFTSTNSLSFYNQNQTTLINNISNTTINGQRTLFGEGSNQLFGASWNNNKSIFTMRNINNYTTKWTYSLIDYQYEKYDLANSSLIVMMSSRLVMGMAILEVRTIVNSISTTIINSQNIPCSNYTKIQVKGSLYNFGVYNGSQVQVYNYCTNCTPIWTLNITNLSNFQFCDVWFLYSTNGMIYQHDIYTGNLISTLKTGYTISQVKIIGVGGKCLTSIFQTNQSTILRAYLDNSVGTYTSNQTVSSYIDFLNYSIISTNQTMSNNTSKNITNHTINITNNSTISPQFNIYSDYLLKDEFLQNKFDASLFTQDMLTTTTTFNSFRMRDLFRIYFIINQLGFHNYHNVNYTGIVKNILDFMSYFQTNIWTITNSQQIINGIQGIYYLPSYINYTNPMFIKVQGKDSLFLENTKDYFFMSVPVSLLSFFLLHFMYKALKCSELGIKSIFKSFSLPYGIILVLFIQNFNRLSFLSCHNFLHLFSFNTLLYFLQGITVTFVGFVIILTVSFFYIIRYLYGKKIKSVSFNIRRVEWWSTILMIRFVIRPIIEIACNVFLFQNYNFVILSLCITQMLIVVILSWFQLSYNCFYKKMQFVDQSLFNLGLCLFNFILYLKHYAYPELEILFEWCIEKLVYFLMFIIFIDLLIFIVSIGNQIQKIFKKQDKDKQITNKLKIKKRVRIRYKLRVKQNQMSKQKHQYQEYQNKMRIKDIIKEDNKQIQTKLKIKIRTINNINKTQKQQKQNVGKKNKKNQYPKSYNKSNMRIKILDIKQLRQ